LMPGRLFTDIVSCKRSFLIGETSCDFAVAPPKRPIQLKFVQDEEEDPTKVVGISIVKLINISLNSCHSNSRRRLSGPFIAYKSGSSKRDTKRELSKCQAEVISLHGSEAQTSATANTVPLT